MIQNVGLNPTRSALLDFLLSIGAPVKVLKFESINGEILGDIEVRHAPVRGGVIEKDLTAALIDEIPVLAVLGAASEQAGSSFGMLRSCGVKETDRISTVAANFSRMGIEVDVTPDGMRRSPAGRSSALPRSTLSAIIESPWRSRSGGSARGDAESTIDNAGGRLGLVPRILEYPRKDSRVTCPVNGWRPPDY